MHAYINIELFMSILAKTTMFFVVANVADALLFVTLFATSWKDINTSSTQNNGTTYHVFDKLTLNSWQKFSTWNNSWPSPRYFGRAALVYFVRNGVTYPSAIFHGGSPSDRQPATWIYNLRSNAWRAVWTTVSGEQPTSLEEFSMISLCSRTVVLYQVKHGLGRGNDVWIFDETSQFWHKVDFSQQSQVPQARLGHSAVVVSDPTSSCRCKESMLIYGGKNIYKKSLSDIFGDLWEFKLQCVKDAFSYRWKMRGMNNTNRTESWPQPRHSHVAISAFHGTMMYVYGGYSCLASVIRCFCYQVLAYSVTSSRWKVTKAPFHYNVFHGVYIARPTPSFLLCSSPPIMAYDLMSEVWSRIAQIPQNSSLPYFAGQAVISLDRTLVLFGGFKGLRRQISNGIYQLTMLEHSRLVWKVRPKPSLSPLRRRAGIVAASALNGKVLIAFGGRNDGSIYYSSNELWLLNMTSMTWSMHFPFPGKLIPFGAKGVVLSETQFFVFGGCGYNSETFVMTPFCSNYTWIYLLSTGKWARSIASTAANIVPVGRKYHSMVKRNDDVMFLFGGFAYDDAHYQHALSDLWMFALADNSTHQGRGWTTVEGVWMTRLSAPVFGHAATFVGASMFVYGGLVDYKGGNGDFDCNSTFWEYNSLHKTWDSALVNSRNTPGNQCFHSMVSFGRHVILISGCSGVVITRFSNGSSILVQEIARKCNLHNDFKGVWAFNTDNGKWVQFTNQVASIYQIDGPQPTLLWRDNLLTVGGRPEKPWGVGDISTAGEFSVFKLACPKGFYSEAFPHLPCKECSLGTFVEIAGSTNCTPCPSGLTTSHICSSRRDQCTVCAKKYCGHGSCTVVEPGPEAYCLCDFGFTKNAKGQCNSATFYIAGSCAAVGLILLILMIIGAIRVRSTRRKDKKKIENKEKEIVDLTNVWVVDSRELVLQERIDGDTPGGFGEVYKAEYREITVAVKRLQQLQRIERMELEFEREIEVMRSIRHPNIVLFLGGGRSHDDGCPFLVVEYLPRGSLSSLLREQLNQIDCRLKISFALDVARGMLFLHSLKPPRVHRDLKSGNCLVSDRFVVKVADFGCARLVKQEGTRQASVRGCGPLSLTEPLLQPEYELTTAIGTAQWTAPEILRGEDYGTPVDVYSFGIVLWEIWSRAIPYEDTAYGSIIDFKDSVRAGRRPTVFDRWPERQRALMGRCWQDEPEQRPTFSEVVQILLSTQNELTVKV